jgi:hypothetical protein
MKNKLIIFLFSIVLSAFAVQSFVEKPSCINLYVDYGSLSKQNKVSKCIEQDNINALDFIKQSGYTTEGTIKYGDAVLCRLNNLPSNKEESCSEMPPENAYWAVIIKKKQTLLIPRNEWGWAEKAINETYLSAGDSIGLVFSTNGDLRWP